LVAKSSGPLLAGQPLNPAISYIGFPDVNKPPTPNAGPDVVVYLPNRAAALDGSRSYNDRGIVEYEWSRDPKSPAAGVSVSIRHGLHILKSLA